MGRAIREDAVTAVEGLVGQIAWLLLGAALIGVLAWRLGVPYAVALVLGGVALAATGALPLPRLEPDVLLFVFLPPLLFDAAFRLDARELRSLVRPVLLLAFVGTVAVALIVGGVLWLLLGMPLAVALLFGAVVAPTDPIAVVAIVRRLRAPNRLAVLLEAESLLNDGVAITLYTALLGLAIGGGIDPLGAGELFLLEVAGGLAFGAGAGLVFSRLSATFDDHLVEMTLSTALAYGSYLVAGALGVSGPLACVAAGLVHGSYGRRIGMSENTRRLLDDLWEYLGFLANGLLFLLVGFTVSPAALVAHGPAVAIAVAAVVLSRALLVGMAGALPQRVRPGATLAERIVLVWGGLRGALTVALALALPLDLPMRDTIVAMAFAVVLFTLVVQGLSLPWLLRRLGFVHH